MSNKNGTAYSAIPKMIIRDKTEANNTIPPLPKMPEEFRYGGEWMDPQWKKDVRVGKKLFTTYPIQMAIILVLVAALAIGLAFASKGCVPKDAGAPAGGYSDTNNDDKFADTDDSDDADDEQDGENTDGSEGFVRPAGTGLEEPIAGNVDEAYIEIIDYNLYEDPYGQRYIVITLNETNNSSDTALASSFFEVYGEQDGKELTHVTGGMEGYGDQYLSDLAPGETRELNLFFRGIDFEGGEATVTLYNFWDENEYVGIVCQMYDLD